MPISRICLLLILLSLHLGSQTPLPLRHEIQGSQIFGALGRSLAGTPDLNGDGVQDLLIGSPAIGQVILVSGATGSQLMTFSTMAVFDDFGASVTALSDVNGDGLADLVVGAPLDSTNASSQGAIHVFSGADGSLLYTRWGDYADDMFGHALDAIEDMNGDGIEDILVGAPGTFSNGFVRILSGKDGSTLATWFGPAPGSGMGWQVVALEDMDGDGLQEVGVSAVLAANSAGDLEAGRLLVISGSGLTLLHDISGLAALDHFGSALSSLGDVNNDGAGDFAVAAVNDNRGGPDAGSVRLYSGATGQLLGDLIGSQSFALFGSALAAVGDVNGDGTPNLAVGAILHDGPFADTGRVTIHNADDGLLISTIDDLESSSQFGAAIAGLGDIDGDSFDDFAASRPNAMGNAFLAGAVKVLSVGGVRSYDAVTPLPPTNRTLTFVPGSTAPASSGSLILQGASPFDTGVLALSFAPGALDFSGIPILLNTDPALLVINQPFYFQSDGTATFAADLRHPFLAGVNVYVQGFDSQFPYGASNALELRLFSL